VCVEIKNFNVKTTDKIIALIEENKEITISEMAKILEKTPRSIERAIQSLKQKGKIKRVGSDKTGSWQVL